MKKKLAITISGAVSLGSYEAGVLYEVVRAIGQHNQNPKTKTDDKIFIDVLTGASAGGMTATIAAQKLLYEAQSLAGEFSNAFYQPWVAEISIQRLLNLHGADNERQSIFSSEAVAEISEKYITGRYQPRWDGKEYEFKLIRIELLSEVRTKLTKYLTLEFPLNDVTEQLSNNLDAVFAKYPGKTKIRFNFIDQSEGIKQGLNATLRTVDLSNELLKELDGLHVGYGLN